MSSDTDEIGTIVESEKNNEKTDFLLTESSELSSTIGNDADAAITTKSSGNRSKSLILKWSSVSFFGKKRN
jgi:hypothetical protein